jgi:hypothetical protein
MDILIILIASIAISFNFVLLIMKWYRGRTKDLMIDGFIFVVLAFLFGGTGTGLVASMISGAIISVYLFFYIPEGKKKKNKKKKKKTKKHAVIGIYNN